MTEPVYTLAIEYYSFHYGYDAAVYEQDIRRWLCEHYIRRNWRGHHNVTLTRDGRTAEFSMETDTVTPERQNELIQAAFAQIDETEN